MFSLTGVVSVPMSPWEERDERDERGGRVADLENVAAWW